MATNLDKVACFECGENLLKKNLKTHYLRFHSDKTVKYRSISQKNVLDLFNKNTGTSLKKKKLTAKLLEMKLYRLRKRYVLILQQIEIMTWMTYLISTLLMNQ